MNALQSTQTHGGAYGVPLMKLTLTFEGELPSSGNSSRKKNTKWAIRSEFHPQLKEACQTNTALRRAFRNSKIPPAGEHFVTAQYHHSDPRDEGPQLGVETGFRDLCAPLQVGNRTFLPIVRESLALGCYLNILFLRREEPGSLIKQGGDLDNRIKTLFDALRVPTADELVEDPSMSDPIHCLLESDALITGFNIKTDRLLTGANKSAHHVHLVVEADIRVLQARSYNIHFLGD